jgi:uncharacterized membrane protein YdfJ with MMPL/SSD domain
VTERLARACAAHPRRTLGLWGLAVVVALVLVATSLHGLTSKSNVIGSPESTKAASAVAGAFPREALASDGDVIVVSSGRYVATASQFRAAVARLVREIRSTGKVYEIGESAVSKNGHAVLVSLVMRTDSDAKAIEAIVAEQAKTPFAAAITGYHSANYDFGKQSQGDLENGELEFGLPAALVVLVLVFGAVVAGLVPLVMAILSIVVALGLVALISLGFSLSIFIVNMLTGMGLALGIDYSLFVVSRYREERLLGAEKEDAIARAGATASRAVLFSGSTFVIALVGMFIVPTSIMRSLALGAILVGVVSVAAALTLLPALLALAGDRVDSLRVPFLGRSLGRPEALEGRFWKRIVDGVLRRPALCLAVAVAGMLAAASPIFGLHIGANGVSTLPSSTPSRVGFEAVQTAFPDQNPQPVQIVTIGGNASTRGALVELERKLGSDPQFGPGTIQTSAAKGVSLLSAPVQGDLSGSGAIAAVRSLRAHVIPALFRGTGARVYVGGLTAQDIDYFDAVSNPTPYVLVFVLGLSFILLTVAFRSIVVALVSIVLNLLSVGAAYGLLTLVFLYGDGNGIFGFEHTHVIDAWVPLFLFSVLFGLSMDYQVFLMSRIKERYDLSGSTREAVSSGISSTARIITGAALIIVVVFAGFAAGKLVMFQQMGFGVAVALLIDATVIRSVVLPSMLALLDRRSWYLPRWLEWLPHVEVEQPPNRGDAAVA